MIKIYSSIGQDHILSRAIQESTEGLESFINTGSNKRILFQNTTTYRDEDTYYYFYIITITYEIDNNICDITTNRYSLI